VSLPASIASRSLAISDAEIRTRIPGPGMREAWAFAVVLEVRLRERKGSLHDQAWRGGLVAPRGLMGSS
jgi:hypothetical protein